MLLTEIVARLDLTAIRSTRRMRDDQFEWDDRKAASNLCKHSISFELARLVFADPLAIDDVVDDEPEDRARRVGMAEGRLLVSSTR